MKYRHHLFVFSFVAEHSRVNDRDSDAKYLNTSHVPSKKKGHFLTLPQFEDKIWGVSIVVIADCPPKPPFVAMVISPESRVQPRITPGTERPSTAPSAGRLSYAGLGGDSEGTRSPARWLWREGNSISPREKGSPCASEETLRRLQDSRNPRTVDDAPERGQHRDTGMEDP